MDEDEAARKRKEAAAKRREARRQRILNSGESRMAAITGSYAEENKKIETVPAVISSPDVSSPDVSSPDVSSPDVSSPDVSSPDVSSPAVCSPAPPSQLAQNTELDSDDEPPHALLSNDTPTRCSAPPPRQTFIPSSFPNMTTPSSTSSLFKESDTPTVTKQKEAGPLLSSSLRLSFYSAVAVCCTSLDAALPAHSLPFLPIVLLVILCELLSIALEAYPMVLKAVAPAAPPSPTPEQPLSAASLMTMMQSMNQPPQGQASGNDQAAGKGPNLSSVLRALDFASSAFSILSLIRTSTMLVSVFVFLYIVCSDMAYIIVNMTA